MPAGSNREPDWFVTLTEPFSFFMELPVIMSPLPFITSAKGINVAYVAQLARIELTPEEVATFESQLPGILNLMQELEKVDVTGVEPTAHGFPLYNVWRADQTRPGLETEVVLANAPATRGNFFSVPPIIE